MAKFRIGQRVRIVGAPFGSTLNAMHVGKETTIMSNEIEINSFNGTGQVDGKKLGYLVDIVVMHSSGQSMRLGYQECHLEPLVDDGRQVTSWEKCLWNPSMIQETV